MSRSTNIGGAENPINLLQYMVSSKLMCFKDYLMGRYLTLADGICSDPEQRKAIKDLMREIMRSDECFTEDIHRGIYLFAGRYLKEYVEKLDGISKAELEKANSCPISADMSF